jgi:hypothetical protein
MFQAELLKPHKRRHARRLTQVSLQRSSGGSKARSTKLSRVALLRSWAPIWLHCKPGSTRSGFRLNRRNQRTWRFVGSADSAPNKTNQRKQR